VFSRRFIEKLHIIPVFWLLVRSRFCVRRKQNNEESGVDEEIIRPEANRESIRCVGCERRDWIGLIDWNLVGARQ
jgi:hypothetical protein